MASYFRIARIDFEYFHQWLNLPEGFQVMGFFEQPEYGGVTLRIACPIEDKYEVDQFKQVVVEEVHMKLLNNGQVRLWWPGLGQEEPE